ncbi:MAG: hypothetical protein KKB20_29210, partial [Proteobacteria bacterium]|nr:hypothetical protein [Pseudomonadota bacterium]
DLFVYISISYRIPGSRPPQNDFTKNYFTLPREPPPTLNKNFHPLLLAEAESCALQAAPWAFGRSKTNMS